MFPCKTYALQDSLQVFSTAEILFLFCMTLRYKYLEDTTDMYEVIERASAVTKEFQSMNPSQASHVI